MKGLVQVDIAKGRRELGWEIGYSAQNGLTTASFTAAVVINNDADFVVRRIWLSQFGSNLPVDPRVAVQVRDGATGQVLLRQAGVFNGLCSLPPFPTGYFNPTTSIPNTRFAANWLGLPAPFPIRRGSSVFFEFANATPVTFNGDIYVGLEGYRVYPGEPEDVPNKITGYALPYSWNGTLVVTANATNAIAKLGTITMVGSGVGHYVLKYGMVFATARTLVAALGGADVAPDAFLGLQIYSSKYQSKRWVHVTNPSSVGDFMPMHFFTGGGQGFPWFQPLYLSGTDTIFADIYANPTAFVGNTPGTIELQLNGVFVPSN